ncbi:NUDIX hydrolase [Parasphingorhabdus sp.]|uniref:NUDIX hydrolase n=1 Tax=Parasphingorhabdus sp. TaxID=2709688 RepID=UPI003265B530
MDKLTDFHGAKVALFADDDLLVYRRDDIPEIPFPNMIDLPGGGRENGESGTECVIRETREEFGITLEPGALKLAEEYENWRGSGAGALFYVGALSSAQVEAIDFGDEGQHWSLMPVSEFVASEEAVPHLKQRVQIWMETESHDFR